MTNVYAVDGNRAPCLQAVLSSDGVTVTPVAVNATRHALKVEDNTTGTSQAALENDPRNADRTTALWATSSADGVTPVAVYCDADGLLLINSN